MAVKSRKDGEMTRSRIPETALSEEALQTRKRILDAAEQVFSRKGFDGARVDEIAEAANVNKALIYYYFESKKSLLEELVSRVVRELVAQKEEASASLQERVDLANSGIPEELMKRGIELTARRMPFFGILSTEALKNDDEEPALFRVLDNYMTSLSPTFEKIGLPVRDLADIRTSAFFFGFAPLMLFQLLKDKWARYYKIDPEELKKEFYAVFAKIYPVAMQTFFAAKQ